MSSFCSDDVERRAFFYDGNILNNGIIYKVLNRYQCQVIQEDPLIPNPEVVLINFHDVSFVNPATFRTGKYQ